MVRVISQETYDEVVQENMQEFDMSAEEAIQEAITQFQAQGVDLSNIIKDLVLTSGDDNVISKSINKLKGLKDEGGDSEIFNELETLKAECNKDIARRVKAGKDGAYTILLDLLEARLKEYLEKANDKDATFIVNVLNCLIALMDVQPDLLDQRGVDLIKSILDNTEDDNILMATLKWTSICCIKHEMNRQRLFAKNIASNLKCLLQVGNNLKLLSEVLAVIRKFPLDDDIRVEFGKAHDHARELGFQLLESLTNLLKEHTKPPLVSELMSTIACLLVRHELCATVAESGSDILFSVLADNADNAAVVQQASKLITALAGNDDVKRQLVKSGVVPVIVLLLTRHASNPSATALTLKSIAALTLREPPHSRQFYDCGAPEAIVDCLKRHPENAAIQIALSLREPPHSRHFYDCGALEAVVDCLKRHPENAAVQKNGCWAIRNIVARCRDMNPKFKELGVEPILNAAYERFLNEFGFDVKSALRDLECDVKLDEQWTGKGVELEQ